MSELSEHAILWNTAALTSLKRAQLTSLSKRYGLRANGKNSEIVQRLYDYGQTLTPSAKDAFDMAAAATVEQDTPTRPGIANDAGAVDPVSPPAQWGMKASRPSTRSLARSGSDAWEVLDNSDASLIEEEDEPASDDNNDLKAEVSAATAAEAPSSSTRTWKSAGNGAPLDEFAHRDQRYGTLRGVGSLRSLASSIRRTASRTLSAQHRADRSPAPAATPTTVFPGMSEADADANNDMEEVLQASPASTVGVPKRLRKYQSEHHRPSTIRVVSPAPSMTDAEIDRDELPLTGQNSVDRIKQRVSFKPMRDGHSHPPVSIRNRRSIPVLMSPATSTPSIYPALPAIDPTAPPEIQRAMAECSPEPELPGSFPASPADDISPTSPSFVFGSRQAVSNTEFSDAGSKLLAEFQAKMGGSGANLFSTELLKGKDAEFDRMAARRAASGGSAVVPSASSSAKPGFGLASRPESSDRYAQSHRREFARMKSLQSVNVRKTSDSSIASSKSTKETKAAGKRKLETAVEPESEPASTSPTEAPVDRDTKRVKPAPAPKPSIIDSFRRSRATSKSPAKAPARSLTKSLGFLRGHRKTPSMLAAESPLKQSSIPVPTKVVSPKKGPAPVDDSSVRSKKSVKKSSPPTAASSETPATSSLASKKSTIRLSAPPRRGGLGDFGPSKPSYEPLKDGSHGSTSRSSIVKASAPPSSSSYGVRPSASVSSSLSRSPGTHHLAHMASGDFGFPSRRDLSAPRSPSVSRLPQSTSSLPRSRSSTLFAPTASSLARRQATLKPPSDKPTGDRPARRPLPAPPTSKTPQPTMLGSSVVTYPFGEASSRTNYHLFDSAFHESPNRSPFDKGSALGAGSPSMSTSTSTLLAKTPAKSTPATTTPKRPLPHTPKTGKSPLSPARQRSMQQRARMSGLNSIKAASGPDAEVARRRADLRAKQQRLGEERSLMRMLE